jgi:hypothetical protein
MITPSRFFARLALASAILVPALVAAPLSAQSSAVDPHWLPWVGCWQTVGPQSEGQFLSAPAANVCVVPTNSASAVEVLTLVDGAITERDRIDASGIPHPSSEEGCVGTELVQWSQDGNRLYRTTDQRCTGNIQRRVTGLLAILPSGEWLNAQGVTIGGNVQTRVLRYRPITQLTGFPAEVTRALEGQRLAIDAARGSASRTPTTFDIVEASKRLDPDVVGAWLIEREQGFALNASKLIELADAGVPESVIDVMVALTYPDKFAINRATGASELRPEDTDSGVRRVGRSYGYDPIYGYGYPYPYRYGYGRGWGWGGYYNGYYGGGYYNGPVVIIRDGNQVPSQGRARAVKGQGYTRSNDGGSTGSSRPAPTRSSGNEGSSSSGGSSASPSSGSGSSGTSTGRTAKPRGS